MEALCSNEHCGQKTHFCNVRPSLGSRDGTGNATVQPTGAARGWGAAVDALATQPGAPAVVRGTV